MNVVYEHERNLDKATQTPRWVCRHSEKIEFFTLVIPLRMHNSKTVTVTAAKRRNVAFKGNYFISLGTLYKAISLNRSKNDWKTFLDDFRCS